MTFFLKLTILGSTIESNAGSGIDGSFSALVVRDTSVINNGSIGISNNDDGGVIANSTISGNSGGGVYLKGGYINDSIISNNTSAGSGGGIVAATSSLSLTRVVVDTNTSEDKGGGLLIYGGAAVTVTDSTFKGNSAVSGGGIFSWGTLQLTKSAIVSNTATADGGGIYNSGQLTIQDSTLALNASIVEGGAIYNEETATIESATLAENTVPVGAANNIYTGSVEAATTVRNSILKGTVNCVSMSSTSFTSLGYNILSDSPCGTPATSDQNVDAGLGTWDTTHSSYPLLATSPAIDNAAHSYCASEDQNRRVRDTACDIGATEYGASFALPGSIGFVADSHVVAEESGVATIALRRGSGSDGEVSVLVQAYNGSAASTSDFEKVDQRLTWADGDTADKYVTVTINDDLVWEDTEDFYLSLLDPQGGASLGTDQTKISITGSDKRSGEAGILQILSDYYPEGSGVVTLYIGRSNGSDGQVSVDFATEDGTALASDDYIPTTGTLTWQDGDSETKNITISLVDDNIIENADKSLTIRLSNPSGGLTIGTSDSVTINIRDDDTTYIAFREDSMVDEFSGAAGLAVIRTGPTDKVSTVSYTTASLTATSGKDFVAQSGTLTFNVGETEKIIKIDIKNDEADEGDEGFEVRLSTPSDAILGEKAAAHVSIIDDDDCPDNYQCIEIAEEGGGGGSTDLALLLLLGVLVFAKQTARCKSRQGGLKPSATQQVILLRRFNTHGVSH